MKKRECFYLKERHTIRVRRCSGRTCAFLAPCARNAESVMPRSAKNILKNNEDGRAREVAGGRCRCTFKCWSIFT